ncbi:tripartite motif-containing protein 29-like [Mytilus edulis]|uniref:tripartite motif-containing protein 29-like n=1 Tax=Mytilus edulis TaxID=6550 RepID=UPI0039EF37E9
MHVVCGSCKSDDVRKYAKSWCGNCEIVLCKDCEKDHRKNKSSRNHKVVSIEDYHGIEHVSNSKVCQHHGKPLEWFCKTHDNCLCVVCKSSSHNSCLDVIPISEASTNAKQSTALSDLEDTIEGTLLNVKQCIKNRESATNEIEKRELEVKSMILETRTKINLHLNKLEEKLLCELKPTTDNCKSKYMNFLKKLEATEELISKLREQTLHMKQFSSDIQVFLGTHQVTNLIARETNSIKNELRDTKDYRFQVTLHELIDKFVNIVRNVGTITVSECAVNSDFRDQKSDQAQIMINRSKDFKRDEVHCCDLDGVELWQFKNELIIYPRGVAVDNKNNVHVVGFESTNLTMIQHDGKNSRTLHTELHRLRNPRAVYDDKDKNILLICNIEGKVALYKVD